MKKERPVHLALHQIRLPLPGIVSILHRISGLTLFFALPPLLWMLQASLTSIETYTGLLDVLEQPSVKLVLLSLLWAFLHHFCAGIRFLLIDLHFLRTLELARTSSKLVLGVSLLFTILIGARLW
jgi:succinate dehydrogenase / fumarate reductase cytochrome b subunit